MTHDYSQHDEQRSQYLATTATADAAVNHDAVIGGRTLVRPLDASKYGQRFLARDPRRDTDCIVWLFDRVEFEKRPRLWDYLKRNAGVRRPHVLTIEAAGRSGNKCWAVTPYVGNHDGIVSLESLREARGGSLSLFETGRAIEQLLVASAAAHADGAHHGQLVPASVLVNPRGTLEIGMYGLQVAIEKTRVAEDLVCDEIRSIGLIADQLLNGEPDGAPIATPERLRPGSALRSWIRKASDPIDGFDSARDAIDALPRKHDEASATRLEAARSLLGRLSSVVSASRPKANSVTEPKPDRL